MACVYLNSELNNEDKWNEDDLLNCVFKVFEHVSLNELGGS